MIKYKQLDDIHIKLSYESIEYRSMIKSVFDICLYASIHDQVYIHDQVKSVLIYIYSSVVYNYIGIICKILNTKYNLIKSNFNHLKLQS